MAFKKHQDLFASSQCSIFGNKEEEDSFV